jgi:type I restriction enzyme, S subunit
MIRRNDLLVGMDGDFNCTRWAGEDGLLNQRVCKIELHSDNYDDRFLAHALPGYLQAINAATSSMTVKHLSSRTVSEIPLPLPPLNEQRRIVAKVEELFSDLDAAVAALERVQAKLKRYRAAVLKAAVEGKLTAEWRAQHPDTEPAAALLDRILAERRHRWEEAQLARYAQAGKEPPKDWRKKYQQPVDLDTSTLPPLPEGWCWVSVEQLTWFLRNGISQKPSATPPGHRILRINAVRPMVVDTEEVRYLNLPREEVAGEFVDSGDLLFTRYNGSVDLLGVVGMVRTLVEPTLHPDKLIRVKTVLPSPLPEYLELACNVGEARRHMVSRARTTAGQTGISGSDVREMPVPLPSLAEQGELLQLVAERLTVLDAVESQVAANLARAARLRQSILKRAFEGRLVPQDPNDEPAEKLLERIRAAAASIGGNRQPARIKRDRQPTLFDDA